MYKRGLQGWLKHIDFIFIDYICMQLAFMLAYAIRHGHWVLYLNTDYLNMMIVLTLIDIFVGVMFASFKNILKRGYYRELAATVKHVCLVELMSAFYLFSTQRGDIYSRTVFYLFVPFYILFSYGARTVWKLYLKKKIKAGDKRSMLIVTTGALLEKAIANIINNNYIGVTVTGAAVLDCDRKGEEVNGIPVVADHENVSDYICRRWIDEVLIVLPEGVSCPTELLDDFRTMGVVIHAAIAENMASGGTRQLIERIGNYTVLTTSLNYATTSQLMLKRTIDIIGGLIGCLVTGILFLFIAPMIYISSPGPIFFVQTRVGKNGKLFKMYKFRTMYMDAEERKKELLAENRISDGMMFKLKYDPRIIGNRKLPDGTVKEGIGSFLRKTSLDEMPQMFNVLKGDMSLVGTRPPTLDEWKKYELHHRARLAIKPGITGMWQVSGRSNITNFDEVVKLDTRYINEWSMGLDFRILFKTVGVVVKNDGAM